MKFLDFAKVYIRSGGGGAGCISFRREKFIEYGGPDGGDGGNGGYVIVEAVDGLNTLIDFRYQQHFFAQNGQHGMGSQRTGKDGEDKILKVPVGTEVLDEDEETVIADLTEVGQRVVIAKGGNGGWGNLHFKSATNQAPRRANPGQECIERTLWLRLKLIADVGLLGMPNAGKSTFLAATSNARPKVADYPFTTLKPNLGIVAYRDFQSFVIADIPGIIEGAAEGKGLGHYFLRHIERNSTLLFLIPVDTPNIKDEYDILVNELTKYNPEMLDKERIVVISKCDMLDDELKAELKTELDKEFAGTPYLFISSVAQQGLTELKDKLWNMLNREDDLPENSHNL